MRNARLFISAVALVPLAAAAYAEDHPHGIAFVHKAVEGDNSETRLGALAARKGQSPAIRAFGQMLETDHSNGRIEAAALARKVHTYAPQSMTPEAIAEQQKLDKLSGKDFDREFASYMVKDHKEDIADFESEASSSDPAVITTFAKKTIPILRKHLDNAIRLVS